MPNVLIGRSPTLREELAFGAELAALKTRPLEIALRCLAEDTDRDIATAVGMSLAAVRLNLRAILGVLGVADRDELLRLFGRSDSRRCG